MNTHHLYEMIVIMNLQVFFSRLPFPLKRPLECFMFCGSLDEILYKSFIHCMYIRAKRKKTSTKFVQPNKTLSSKVRRNQINIVSVLYTETVFSPHICLSRHTGRKRTRKTALEFLLRNEKRNSNFFRP